MGLRQDRTLARGSFPCPQDLADGLMLAEHEVSLGHGLGSHSFLSSSQEPVPSFFPISQKQPCPPGGMKVDYSHRGAVWVLEDTQGREVNVGRRVQQFVTIKS